MNETTRDRDDLQSRSRAAGSNVELETTTTTIEQSCPTGSAGEDGKAANVSERMKAEGEQIRQRAGQAGEQVRRSAAEASQEVRRRTRETAELVREQAAEQAAAVKHRAVEQIDAQKNGFATKICDVSSALKRAADDLEQHEDTQLAAQARQFAQRIEGIGNHIRDSQVSDFVEDAEHFVRRNPTLALGGMFLAGLTLARFLKARPPRYQSAGFQSPTGGGPAGTAQPSSGVNPYMQRRSGGVPPMPHDHELTVGSSDLKVGSTDPTAASRPMGTRSAAGELPATGNRPGMGNASGMRTKPGDMPSSTAGHAASAGITPATSAEANRPSAGSAASPTSTANPSQGNTSQGNTSQGNTSQGNSPQLGSSGSRTPGGSAPRPR